ncbi:unnamed protein product [Caenorhabditis angaria]|uniref:SSD domain-containing protein n=1 Tax=Caenorhabditis angaria TaxID=860376 RepID=A0A9P1IF56_9PELO|nr:unnamed protein product [Caenorhabditis angaria]
MISYVLGNYPKSTLILVLLFLAPLLSYFLIYPLEIECDVRRGFANKNGRAVKELARFSNFYNISVGGLEIWGVLVRNKTPDSNLEISRQVLDEVDRLHKFVWNYETDFKGHTVRFEDVAGTDINYIFNYYRKLLDFEWLSEVNLTWPIANAFGNEFYLGSQFFGVNEGLEVEPPTPMRTAKFIALWYMSKAETFERKQHLQQIQLGIFEASDSNFSQLFDFEMFGDQVANAEMLRGTLITVKLFIIGGLLMITFMALTFHNLTNLSKLLLILGAIGSPLAATGATFALLGWLDHPFNSIMCITPFLILGIGVDDAFLLLNCWRKYKTLQNREHRLARVVQEISPSMAITSLTNTMAFGVGYLSPTPQMSSFCLATSLAIVFDFLFEFLIFVPTMVMFYDSKEEKGDLEVQEKTPESRVTWKSYTSALLSPLGVFLSVSLYLVTLSVTYYGVSTIETTFDPSKTFPSDSKLVKSLESFNYIQQEYTPLNFLSKVPNLQNPADTENFETMLHELETRPGCLGAKTSHNIYRDYLMFWEGKRANESEYGTNGSWDYLGEFLRTRELADRNTIKWTVDGNETKVELINFVVVCRGEPSWGTRAISIENTRNIIDRYPQFETSLFDYDATIYDLIITVKSELFKSLAITFTCMTLACFFIMPSFLAPTIASLATVSISFCLLGFLSIWGQNLDPVTMIDVIMAIGFSVDYSAHVCYHFYCARRKCQMRPVAKKEVIEQVLTDIGRPVIEASITTLLCMAPLFMVPVYMIRSFAKTVTLVTTFGLLHGLIFLPVVLYFIPSENRRPRQNTLTTVPLVQEKH